MVVGHTFDSAVYLFAVYLLIKLLFERRNSILICVVSHPIGVRSCVCQCRELLNIFNDDLSLFSLATILKGSSAFLSSQIGDFCFVRS